MNPSILNPQYNPNDFNSNRWITPDTKPAPTNFAIGGQPFSATNQKTTFGNLFAPIKNIFSKAPVAPTLAPKTTAPATTTVAPVTPTVTRTVETPSATLPNKTGQETTVTVPLAPTPAQTQTTAPTIPTTATGGIDYMGLAKSAGAAGVSVDDYIALVKGQSTPGTAEMKTIYDELGIPGLLDKVYKQPNQTTQQIYQEYYNNSGLADIKNKIATLDTELKTIRDGYTSAVKEHQDNPWISAATRSGLIAREKDIYGQKEGNAISLRGSYLDQYNLGVGEVEKIVGRVAGDLEMDRTLNADKLNYLLNDAERRAGLKTTDATKTGLRYSGDLLKAKTKAERDKEERAYGNQTYQTKLKASLDKANSVGAIVEKALQTNPQGAAYINGIQNALGADTSEQGRNFALSTISGKIAAGDTKGAKEYLLGVAFSKDPKARDNAVAANTVIDTMTEIKSALNDYVAKTGDTNLLRGNIQQIQNKLGLVGDPEAVKINSMITDGLQAVRSQITGAGWGKQEDAEYKTTNANLMNNNRLNMAIIDSAIATAQRKNDAALGTIIGRDTYNSIFKAPTATATVDTSWVPAFITKARAEGKTDDQIETYLTSKGIK